jgi:putative endonuclease
MYITYIIFSQKLNKFYTGQTIDLKRRIEEHNRGKTPFMASGMPWQIIFTKEFNSRRESLKLEKFIKKRGAERFLDDLKGKSG